MCWGLRIGERCIKTSQLELILASRMAWSVKHTFSIEEFAFAFQTPSKTGVFAIGSNRSVTGDGQCDLVLAAGGANRATGTRRANPFGQFSIGDRFSWRCLNQGFPHAFLIRCAAKVQGKDQGLRRLFDKLPDVG